MGDREVQLSRLRGPGQELTIDLDGALVLPKAHAGGRIERAVSAILGLGGQQLCGLILGLAVQVALDQQLRVVEARGMVIGRALEHRLEQYLRIIEYLALDADARQQTHGLDVIAMLEQERADELLGCPRLAVGEQRGRRHHLIRQCFQCRDVRGRRRRVRGLPGHPVQALEHAPAARQGRIEVHASQQGLDRLRRLLERDMAVATFLVQTAEARMKALELLKRRECRGGLAEMALRHGAQVQHVAILRHAHEEGFGRLHSVRETPLLKQFACAPDLELDHRGTVHT